MNWEVSILIPSFSERSLTLSDSCLPPPLVSRMNGIWLEWRKLRDSEAPGIGAELRTRTPSILADIQHCLWTCERAVAYSNAKAKSGAVLLLLLLLLL